MGSGGAAPGEGSLSGVISPMSRVAAVQGISVEPVSRWLEDHIDGVRAPFEFTLIAGGRSNLTYRVVDAAGTAVVLRRPPLGHMLATAHDMAREHLLISAVGRTPVPVPPALGLCTDEAVTGAPFYVMDWVDGEVLDHPAKLDRLALELRRPAAEHLIDVLADLHAVDPAEVGLGHLARPGGYVERQVRRWSRQWEQSKTRELPAIDTVAAALAARIPDAQATSITHGDYRFGNCLTDVGRGRIAAVLDWELCTLGDPLADVGYLGVHWGPQADPSVTSDPTSAPGFPDFEAMVQRYSARTGRDLADIDYYVAFSCWRMAVICEGVYARYLLGAMGDQGVDVGVYRTAVEVLAERAVNLLGRGR
jgi:aminoglycoside phosphotransferase (APT) family kinase protein